MIILYKITSCDFSPDSEIVMDGSYYRKMYFYDPDDVEIDAPVEYLLCQYLLPSGAETDACDSSIPNGDPLGIHLGSWCTVKAKDPIENWPLL